MALLVDSREHAKRKVEVLAAIPSAVVEWLPKSDFLLFDDDGHTIAIERKAINDLLSSMTSRRLRPQLEGLAQFDRGILLIEGQWRVDEQGVMWIGNRKQVWRPQSVHAILLALQEQLDIKVMWTSGFNETLVFLKMLNSRSEKGCFWKA